MEQYIPLILIGVGMVLAGVCIVLFKKYVAPWLDEKRELIKSQLGTEEYNFLTSLIKNFMAMAEERIGAGHGKQKSELVISWVKEIFPNVNTDYVQALIDGFMKVLTKDGILNSK